MEQVLLIGHGSPKTDANNISLVGNLLHQMMHPGCGEGCVRVAYLQFAEPGIPEAIAECVRKGATRIIVHPFFLSSGMHVTTDIPAMIRTAEAEHPGVEFIYTEPLGVHEKLARVVMERIDAAKGSPPQGIEEKSFEIISEEFDLSDVPPDRLPIVKRVIHATADPEFRRTLLFHPEAISAGINAIRAGKDILTDVEMVRTGINKKLLERWGGRVVCGIREVEDDTESSSGKGKHGVYKTRAERGIEQGLSESGNVGIIAIGNAPTALLRLIEIFNSPLRPASPLLVVGVPVGFVNAIESKTLLATQDFPFITNLSRKGGTPVAVATVNALLKMAGEQQ